MKILKKDLKNGKIKLQPENLDDIWCLSQVIDSGDTIAAYTLRKIMIGNDNNSSAIRKRVYLKIKAEKIEFTTSSSWLRVLGVIVDGPDDVPRGTHHTINIEPGTAVEITKPEWLQYQLEKIKEATISTTSSVMIVVFDRESATFAMLNKRGYDIIGEIHGDVQKKANPSSPAKNFFKELALNIGSYNRRYTPTNIILASSSIWKDYLLKELPPELTKKIVFTTANSCGRNGVNEVLKKKELQQILKKERTSKEIIYVEQVLTEISKSGLAVYGFDEVKKAVDFGAVDYLIMTGNFLRESRDTGKYKELENLMRLVEKSKGRVHIISSNHEGGKKLDGIGGIAALLRFPIS